MGGIGDCCQTYTTCARTVALLLVIFGFLFSSAAAASCRFLSYNTRDGDTGEFGLFFFENMAGSCQRYIDKVFDITDKTARVGALIAPIFALASIILQLVDILCWRVCCGKCIETSVLLLAIIFQGLTFAAFGSTEFCIFTVGRNCYISRGGICSIVAFLLYFTGGVVGCFTPKPKPILCRQHKKEEYDSESDDDDDDESSGVDEDGIEEAQDEEKRKK